MAIADRIQTLITPELERLGYELVRVRLMGGGGRTTLQIMAERADGAPMRVEDCEAVSHHLSPLLDRADPIAARYMLEVSSPGIDRPLTRLKDFARFSGHEARVQLRHAIGGRRNFSGRLCGVADGMIGLEAGAEKPGTRRMDFPLAEVETARLVMTDELLKTAAKAG